VRRAALLGAAFAAGVAAALGACGPYAQLAQKLDVTARIAGDTWIAAVGPGRDVIRILLVARPDANGNAPFAFSDLPSGSPMTTTTLQGTWTETAGGDVTLRVAHSYVLPNDNSGARRDDSTRVLHLNAIRDSAGRLVLSGDPALAGTYVGFAASLRNLGTATQISAACAFFIPNLAVMTSEIRIIGFGGGAMIQYRNSSDFVGTVAGKVTVSVRVPNLPTPSSNVTTTISYSGFQDFGAVTLDGPQITDTTLSANGHMSGVLRFALAPAPLDPSGATTVIQGSIDYGSVDPSNAVQIKGGNPVGGSYLMSIDGGASNVLVPVTFVNTPSSAVADCLALP
jgi:hypothetical protein